MEEGKLLTHERRDADSAAAIISVGRLVDIFAGSTDTRC